MENNKTKFLEYITIWNESIEDFINSLSIGEVKENRIGSVQNAILELKLTVVIAH